MISCHQSNPCSANNKKRLVVLFNDKDGNSLRMNARRIIDRVLLHEAQEIVLWGFNAMVHKAFGEVLRDVSKFKRVILRTNGFTLQKYGANFHLTELLELGQCISGLMFDIWSPEQDINRKLFGLKKPIVFHQLIDNVMRAALPRKVEVSVQVPLFRDGVGDDAQLLRSIYLAQSLCATSIVFYELPQLNQEQGFVKAANLCVFKERRHMRTLEPFTEGCSITDSSWFTGLSVTLKSCCGHVSSEHIRPPTLEGHCEQTDYMLVNGCITKVPLCLEPTTPSDEDEEV